MPKSGITVSEWLHALEELETNKSEVIPEGWYSVRDLALLLGKGISTIRHLISKLKKDGKVEEKKYRITLSCFTRPVPHYRLSNFNAEMKRTATAKLKKATSEDLDHLEEQKKQKKAKKKCRT